MTVTQDARNVLSHLLSQLQEPSSRFYSRYGLWVLEHGQPQLEEFLSRCLRPEVLTYMQLGNGTVTSMKNIGGNLGYEGRAVYLHGVLGQDKRTRVYIGQARSLSLRLKQHWNFRYRRDNPSLHYHAVQNSIFDVFAVLATLPLSTSAEQPGMDQPDLLLNLLEMWCCLLFRSLPPQILAEFLPAEPGEAEYALNVGLNIASPLDHGKQGGRDFVDLTESEDPLVLQYIRGTDVKITPEEKISPAVSTELLQQPVLAPATLFFIGTTVLLGFMLLRRSPGSPKALRWR